MKAFDQSTTCSNQHSVIGRSVSGPGMGRGGGGERRGRLRVILVTGWVGMMLMAGGCRTAPSGVPGPEESQRYTAVGIQPGDLVRIMFPAAERMNSAQQVQSDGTIALPLGGSLTVRGKSATQVEKELLAQYGTQLVVQQVTVTVESAGFSIFVNGAVLRPGKVQVRQSVTLLEALAEAGGPVEGRANLRRVKVVRTQDDGTSKTFEIDLKSTLKGEQAATFYVRPSDVIYVPERFSFY